MVTSGSVVSMVAPGAEPADVAIGLAKRFRNKLRALRSKVSKRQRIAALTEHATMLQGKLDDTLKRLESVDDLWAGEVKSLTEQLETARLALDVERAAHSALQEVEAGLRSELDRKSRRISSLETELVDLEQFAGDRPQDEGVLLERQADCKNRVAIARCGTIVRLEQQLLDSQQTADDQLNKIASLEQQIRDAEQSSKEGSLKISDLTRQVLEAEQVAVAQKSQILRLEKQVRDTNKMAVAQHEKISSLERQADFARRLEAERIDSIVSLEKQMQDQKKASLDQARTIETLEGHVKEGETVQLDQSRKISCLEEQAGSAEDVAIVRNRRVVSLEKQVRDAELSAADKLAKISALEVQVGSAQRLVADRKERILSLKTQVLDTEKLVGDQSDEILSLGTKLLDSEKLASDQKVILSALMWEAHDAMGADEVETELPGFSSESSSSNAQMEFEGDSPITCPKVVSSPQPAVTEGGHTSPCGVHAAQKGGEVHAWDKRLVSAMLTAIRISGFVPSYKVPATPPAEA